MTAYNVKGVASNDESTASSAPLQSFVAPCKLLFWYMAHLLYIGLVSVLPPYTTYPISNSRQKKLVIMWRRRWNIQLRSWVFFLGIVHNESKRKILALVVTANKQ